MSFTAHPTFFWHFRIPFDIIRLEYQHALGIIFSATLAGKNNSNGSKKKNNKKIMSTELNCFSAIVFTLSFNYFAYFSCLFLDFFLFIAVVPFSTRLYHKFSTLIA